MDKADKDPSSSGNVTFLDSNLHSKIFLELVKMRASSFFSDISIVVDGVEFPCHRLILAASSSYFRAMFSSKLKESFDNKVFISNFSPFTMKRIIDYVYTGKVDITVNNVEELLEASSLFHYPSLLSTCCDFLKSHLHITNCLGIERIAKLYNNEELLLHSQQMIRDHFEKITKVEEFMLLDDKQLIFWFKDSLIDISREEVLLEAVLRWMKHEPVQRMKLMEEILSYLKWNCMNEKNFAEIFQKPVIKSNSFLQNVIRNLISNRKSLTVEPRPSTLPKPTLVYIGAQDSVQQTTVVALSPDKNRWKPFTSIGVSLTHFSACVIGNDIVVTGGIVDNEVVATMYLFRCSDQSWQDSVALPKPRANHSAAALETDIFTIGGITLYGVPLEEIHLFSQKSQQWSVVGRTAFPRRDATLLTVRGRLCSIGGMSENSSRSIECFEFSTKGNATILREHYILPELMRNVLASVLNECLYLYCQDTAKFIYFDMEKRSYRRLADPPVHAQGSLCTAGNRIYLSGKLVDAPSQSAIACYDVEKNRWTRLDIDVLLRATHKTVVVIL